jgi:hypothetical protein
VNFNGEQNNDADLDKILKRIKQASADGPCGGYDAKL